MSTPDPLFDDHDDHRSGQRKAVDIPATLRELGRTRFNIDVLDLSVGGFRCRTLMRLEPGAPIAVTLPNLSSLTATVKWRSDYDYGCAFDRPLHPAVVDDIARR